MEGFKETIQAMEEIEQLKNKYNLSAVQVFVLQILKSRELTAANYNSMKEYFINSK